MDYSEIYAAVIEITKRPDMAQATANAVKGAILKAHHSDFFYRDLVEIAVEFDAPRLIQTFDPRQVVTRYRKVKYIRSWQGGYDGTYGPFIEQIQVEASQDIYGCSKENVFYMAGQYLQIRTRPPLERILFGCYVHPPLDDGDTCQSWIAGEFPYTIIYEAARQLFLIMGYQEQSAAMRSLVAEEYAALSLSNVDAVPT